MNSCLLFMEFTYYSIYKQYSEAAPSLGTYKALESKYPDSSALSRKNPWTCSTVQKDDLPILMGFGNSPFWTISQNLDSEIGMIFRICGTRIKAIEGVDESDAVFGIALP